jgi:hypothetical protein
VILLTPNWLSALSLSSGAPDLVHLVRPWLLRVSQDSDFSVRLRPLGIQATVVVAPWRDFRFNGAMDLSGCGLSSAVFEAGCWIGLIKRGHIEPVWNRIGDYVVNGDPVP